jgi:hypothetical protein
MPQDALQVLVGTGAKCYVGLDDATAPTDSDTDLTTGWVDIGFVSEDGATIRFGATSEGVPVWQSSTPVRTIKQETESQVEFALMQWFGDSLIAAFGGGTVSASGTAPNETFRYDAPKGGDGLRIHRLAIGWADRGYSYRLYVPMAQVADVTEAQIVRTEAADIPLTWSMLEPGGGVSPWSLLSDDPAFDPTDLVLVAA